MPFEWITILACGQRNHRNKERWDQNNTQVWKKILNNNIIIERMFKILNSLMQTIHYVNFLIKGEVPPNNNVDWVSRRQF